MRLANTSVFENPGLPGQLAAFLLINTMMWGASPRKAPPILASVSLQGIHGYFEPNLGQAGRDTRFIARGYGPPALLTSDGAIFGSIRMQFVGAQRSDFRGIEPLPAKSNYFIGNRPEEWRVNVPHYKRILEKDVYPGVDVEYYLNGQGLEYDFFLSPGADPSKIAISFNGAKAAMTGDGDILLTAGRQEVKMLHPGVYQVIAGRRKQIASRYRLGQRGIGFELARYDAGRELIIDPLILRTTFVGGSSGDSILTDIKVAGNAYYVCGFTPGITTQAPTGYDKTPALLDIMVLKFADNDTTNPLYVTYLGGSQNDASGRFGPNIDDNVTRLLALEDGSVVVAGTSLSGDYPTTEGAFSRTKKGTAEEVVVTKLNPGGNGLIFSTYLGGSDVDMLGGISKLGGLDAPIYLAGTTLSLDFPTTLNAYDSSFNGIRDMFVTALRADGKALVYSTYFGAENYDQGEAILVIDSSTFVVGGETQSAYFPLTQDNLFPSPLAALQAEFNGVVAVFQDGRLTSSILLGRGFYSVVKSLAYYDGAIYAGGFVESGPVKGAAGSPPVYPATPFAFGQKFNDTNASTGAGSGFIAKLRMHSGSLALIYNTAIGGPNTNSGIVRSLVPTSNGDLWFACRAARNGTAPLDIPVVNGPNAAVPSSLGSAVIGLIDATGTRLLESTILGGSGYEEVFGLAIDSSSRVYAAGFGSSPDLQFASNQHVGSGDGIVAALSPLAMDNCSYEIQEPGGTLTKTSVAAFSADGGPSSLTVSSTPGCLWHAFTLADWIKVNSPSGTATGPVSFEVTANSSGSSRSAYVIVGDTALRVDQGSQNIPFIADGGVLGAGLSSPPVRVLSSGALVSIFGENFAPTGTLRSVGAADLVDGVLPTRFAGVCVEVNGILAPLILVSPGQINAQLPSNLPAVPISYPVEVLAQCGTPDEKPSNLSSLLIDVAAPEFFYFPWYSLTHRPVAARDAVTGALVGPAESGFQEAKPGDYIAIYGTGFGDLLTAGSIPDQLIATKLGATVKLGGRTLPASDILYAGVAPGAAGLDQLNIRIPDDMPAGDQDVILTLKRPTPSIGFLRIGR